MRARARTHARACSFYCFSTAWSHLTLMQPVTLYLIPVKANTSQPSPLGKFSLSGYSPSSKQSTAPRQEPRWNFTLTTILSLQRVFYQPIHRHRRLLSLIFVGTVDGVLEALGRWPLALSRSQERTGHGDGFGSESTRHIFPSWWLGPRSVGFRWKYIFMASRSFGVLCK